MSPAPAGRRERVVAPELLSVAPEIVGRPLAAPWRRAAAMGLDLACVGIVSRLGLAVLLGAGAFASWRMARRQRARWRRRTAFAAAGVAALLAVLSVGKLGKDDGRPVARILIDGEDSGFSAGEVFALMPDVLALGEARSDEEADELAHALVDRLRADAADPALADRLVRRVAAETDDQRIRAALERALEAGPPEPAPDAAPLIADYAAALAAGDAARAEGLRPQVAVIVAAPELARSRAQATRLREMNREAQRDLDASKESGLGHLALSFADDLGLGVGWGVLYFTALTAAWRGSTLGKRLLRVRVVRLDGRPITWWSAFSRCGGYFACLFTGLLGFIEILWDPLRQGLHDRVEMTVVVRDEGA